MSALTHSAQTAAGFGALKDAGAEAVATALKAIANRMDGFTGSPAP
jgi:hypothetical protein